MLISVGELETRCDIDVTRREYSEENVFRIPFASLRTQSLWQEHSQH